MSVIKDIKSTPSGVYALAVRGGDVSPVVLSDKRPQWDYLNSGSYIAIPEAEWKELQNTYTKKVDRL